MPVRALITPGPTTDCTQASKLISGIAAEYLLADKGYDSNAILDQAKSNGTKADCTQAHSLIEGLDADNLLADRATIAMRFWIRLKAKA